MNEKRIAKCAYVANIHLNPENNVEEDAEGVVISVFLFGNGKLSEDEILEQVKCLSVGDRAEIDGVTVDAIEKR